MKPGLAKSDCTFLFSSYADWYKPPSNGGQPAIHADTKDAHLFQLGSGQPSADQGSLCVVMMTTSPHASLSWAKIPCDYPISKAGMICKKRAKPGTPFISYHPTIHGTQQ